MIDSKLAIQFQTCPCSECKGTGRVRILGRARSLRTGKPDILKMRCPVCGGTGRHGVRTKRMKAEG
jgi:DnaJ-class molecular chaperone